MSNFLHRGKREAKIAQNKEVKQRMKHIYDIMDELDDTAKRIYHAGVIWNEDNIQEVAQKYTDIKIESMEGFLLLGKLQNLTEHYDKIRANAEKVSSLEVREGDSDGAGEVDKKEEG